MEEDYLIEAEAFFRRGDACLKEKDYDGAIEYHKEAVEIAPELYQNNAIEMAYKNLSKICLGKTDYEKAKEYQKKAVEVKRLLAEVAAMSYNSRGIVFLNNREYGKAINCFKKAVKIKPDYSDAQKNLNNIDLEKRKIIEEKEAKKASEANLFNSMGLEYFQEKQYDKAIKYYKNAIKIKPDNAVAYNNLGTVYRIRKEYDKALECYGKALEISPNYTTAVNNMLMLKRLMK
jgi:tetratricopeptide (TPR) repeat protein